jgi:homoserine acetyltransferase
MIYYRTAEAYDTKFGRRRNEADEWLVKTYLHHQVTLK